MNTSDNISLKNTPTEPSSAISHRELILGEYIQRIFVKRFPTVGKEKMTPFLWLPKWIDVEKEPSAMVLQQLTSHSGLKIKDSFAGL